MTNPEVRALISLHDVMPESFADVEDVLMRLEGYGIPPVTLLVVPGKPWRPEHLDRLRNWASMGYTLAAHGWIHEARSIRNLYHRLHSWIISRNVAEHLEWDARDIYRNMVKSVAWFAENGLPVPGFYVPPAWALGNIKFPYAGTVSGLEGSHPFPAHVEVLRGIIDTRTGAFRSLPLVGFEADTWVREHFVRLWNRAQLSRSSRTGDPVRIGLHPYDFNLRLSGELERLLSAPNLTPLDFSSWLKNS